LIKAGKLLSPPQKKNN